MPLRAPLAALAPITLFCATSPLTQANAQAQAVAVAITCPLTILHPDTGTCRGRDQRIAITEAASAWQVRWNAARPSAHGLVADMDRSEGAEDPGHGRDLSFRDKGTRASQRVTVDTKANMEITGHQPHAGTPAVSRIGTCEALP